MDRHARNTVSDTVFVNLTKKPPAIENMVHLASGTSISSLTYIYAFHLYSLLYLALLSGFKDLSCTVSVLAITCTIC